MKIAATGDIHFSPPAYEKVREQMARARDEADVLVITGDFTNFGRMDEMDQLLNALVRLRMPIIAVLGNHDYESGKSGELARMLQEEGIKVLDGTSYERDGVGFAGTKGFAGGFGSRIITPFGEPAMKAFVQASLEEALKLECALSKLETEKRVVVLHYSPIPATVKGESEEIFPFMGSSRFCEVIDRHGADLVVHGHAHHGSPDGITPGGIPVHNVALHLLMEHMKPPQAYRVFDV